MIKVIIFFVIGIVIIRIFLGIGIVIMRIIINKRRAEETQRRKEEIYQKYGRTEIADKIINATIWVGETKEQLEDSLGKPIDVDEVVLKTKRKEVWKYCPKGTNRFGLRITMENDVAVGWDEKM